MVWNMNESIFVDKLFYLLFKIKIFLIWKTFARLLEAMFAVMPCSPIRLKSVYHMIEHEHLSNRTYVCICMFQFPNHLRLYVGHCANSWARLE